MSVSVIQRACNCGKSAGDSGKCTECEAEEKLGFQAKLTVNSPGDKYEREADQVADRVMSGRQAGPITPLGSRGATGVQRQDAESEEEEDVQLQRQEEDEEQLQMKGQHLQRQENDEEEETVQTKPAVSRSATTAGAPAAAAAVASGGQPLGRSERAYFEPRFGRDLSFVRLHTDATTAKAARQINARAYTSRNHIAFAPGEYAPGSPEGRRLMAHEITHTMQQGTSSGLLQRVDGDEETGTPTVAPSAPTAPTAITLPFNNANAVPAGESFTVTADGTSPTVSLLAGTATPSGTTAISSTGDVTIDAAQAGGELTIKAENSAGFVTQPFNVASIPTAIVSTTDSSDLTNATTRYGAAFQHTFDSAAGSSNVMEKLRLSEHFPNVPTPNASTHLISGADWPFGRGRDRFTLSTKTLSNTASGAWTVDTAGQFGPSPNPALADGDNVSTHKDLIKVADHVANASNATPRNTLPVELSLDQELHFFNPVAPSGARWTRFVTTQHKRKLHIDSGDLKFSTTVNGEARSEEYEGPPTVTGITASATSIARSSSGTTNTADLTANVLPDPLPTGTSIRWSFVGNRRRCRLTPDATDSTKATLTAGNTTGDVTVRARTARRVFDQIRITIT